MASWCFYVCDKGWEFLGWDPNCVRLWGRNNKEISGVHWIGNNEGNKSEGSGLNTCIQTFLYIWLSWTDQCFKGCEILNIKGLGGNRTSI